MASSSMSDNSQPMNATAAPSNFPADQCKPEFLKAFNDHQVLIVSGPTGSGKTTCLTRFMLGIVPRGSSQNMECNQDATIYSFQVTT